MTGWRKVCDVPGFIKWRYKDSPYRVIADLDESRGHYRALFTSHFPGESYQIRGNCGGGAGGQMMAVAAAKNWMDEHKNGCPPPGEMT